MMKRYTIHCDGGALPVTKFCPNCGTPHECTAETLTNVEAEETKRVRIQAERDIRIAELQAGAAKHIAEVEADSEADHLEGLVEGVELASGDGSEEGEPAGEPVVVQVDSGDSTEEEAEIIEEPPVVEPVPVPTSRKEGWWGAYR